MQWGVFEWSMNASVSGNPFTSVDLSAQFAHNGRTVTVNGFYDGESGFKIRFMPDAAGGWTFTTKSNARELNGKTGRFTCTPAGGDNHGPVRVRNTFDFGYADGTPFYPVGTTCYAWVWQGDERVNQTLETLEESPFNKIRMCVFPKQYDVYIQNEPFCYPFEGSKEDGWDFTRFNPVYFRYFEDKIARLADLGIEADVILFHPYDWGKWGFDSMPAEVNERYLRYLVARIAAYRNVWWSMANEWDCVGSKTVKDWDRLFRILAKKDPYGHPCSMHNGMKWYDHSKPYITHLSVQTTDFFHIQDWRKAFQKPVLIDECVYEGDIPTDWGNLSAEEMTGRFWQVTCRGGYCTHGETYLHPENVLWWSKGGVLHGQSPDRIGFLRLIMEKRPEEGVYPFHNLWNKEMILIKDKEYYLYYYGYTQQKAARLRLPEDVKFKVEVIDTWNMTLTPVEGLFSGNAEIRLPGTPWMAVRAVAADG
ncbi:DUF5605 domain-containing protein [bacterium]|nr:DUF5605 domain-containing protein [bacterium]